MDSKHLQAKKDALMGMSSKLREDTRKPMGEELGKKKMEKIVIQAPDKAGLVKGLSKAQEILKAKFGEAGLSDEVMSDMDESLEDESLDDGTCPVCGESSEDMHEHEMPEDEESELE